MKADIVQRITNLEQEIQKYPSGTLTYKKIKGKEQPYLQWTENGRSKCRYIRVDERESVLLAIEERENKKAELRRLREYYVRVQKILKDNPYLASEGIPIGEQSFSNLIERKSFYVDKTYFIKDWWENRSPVTLITRPRRFGKTLTLNMLECFFSTVYRGRSDLFCDLMIWREEKYRRLQGTYPVIFLTLADVKESDYQSAQAQVSHCLLEACRKHEYLGKDDVLAEDDKRIYRDLVRELGSAGEDAVKRALRELSRLLYLYYGKKVIILLDEYDTPVQEAYFNGYLEDMLSLIRKMFHMAFKGNAYLDRALLTGITRITQQSVFSDLNNLYVVTTTGKDYADVFGFTEAEVFDALDCQNMEEKQQVKEWYDGFTFGDKTDIYNPWSIVNYLHNRQFRPYWANTSSNEMVSRIIRGSTSHFKKDFEVLIQGGAVREPVDENIIYSEIESNSETVWSFLLATGYLRADNVIFDEQITADLSITNRETRVMFGKMIQKWFQQAEGQYRDFCQCLLDDDVEMMNEFLNEIILYMASYFDTAHGSSGKWAEQFYHGLVLGLIVEMRDRYRITSNRESGYGRYDIMMQPLKEGLHGIIIEFKVRREKKEASLEETAEAALRQIKEKGYEAELVRSGLRREQIRKYGFAFEGKQVLIVGGI